MGQDIVIYGLKSCDTCRKARRAMPQARFVDLRDEGIPAAVRDRALAAFPDRLINTRSTTWRELDEADRAAPAADLLERHPALMKRPLIAVGDDLLLGWGKETQEALAGRMPG